MHHLRVDFGLERDSGRRFALWTLLYMLDAAPDLDVAFEDPAEREAARNIMDMIANANGNANGFLYVNRHKGKRITISISIGKVRTLIPL